MVLTFRELQDKVLRMVDETAAGSPTTLALVKDFLNSAHAQRCLEFPWTWMLWPVEVTLATVPGQRLYTLHEEFGRPLYLRNNTTKQYMREVPMRSLPQHQMDWNQDSGDVDGFFWAGLQPITKQPLEPETVSIVSSSTSDTSSAKSIVVYGQNASGHLVSETLTPSGTTTVTSTTEFYPVTEVTKSTSWTGTMTMTIDGDSVLTLLPDQMGKQYRAIQLVDLPTNSQTIGYRFFRSVRHLTHDSDIPLLPAPWSEILVWDALLMMASYLTESNGMNVSLFTQRQRALEVSMYKSLGDEGQTLESSPLYVRYMDAQRDDPRFS